MTELKNSFNPAPTPTPSSFLEDELTRGLNRELKKDFPSARLRHETPVPQPLVRIAEELSAIDALASALGRARTEIERQLEAVRKAI